MSNNETSLRHLRTAFNKGRDELAQGLRALPDSMPISPISAPITELDREAANDNAPEKPKEQEIEL